MGTARSEGLGSGDGVGPSSPALPPGRRLPRTLVWGRITAFPCGEHRASHSCPKDPCYPLRRCISFPDCSLRSRTGPTQNCSGSSQDSVQALLSPWAESRAGDAVEGATTACQPHPPTWPPSSTAMSGAPHLVPFLHLPRCFQSQTQVHSLGVSPAGPDKQTSLCDRDMDRPDVGQLGQECR